MTDEFNIMISIYRDLSNNLEQIKTSQTNIKKVKQSIEKMDNNYFNVKCDDNIFKNYLNMFEDIDEYNKMIYHLETLKLYLIQKIQNMCKHEWVCDLVDITPDKSQHICYCRLCEVTMK
jgi:hypothetical protein